MADIESKVTSGSSVNKDPHFEDAVAQILGGGLRGYGERRVLTTAEYSAFLRDLSAHRTRWKDQLIRKSVVQQTLTAKILAVVKAGSTFRGRSGFSQPETVATMESQIGQLTESGHPLVFVLPIGGGKIANPLKSGVQFLPDTSEWIAMLKLSALAEAIGAVYEPGALIITLPDAPLHTAETGFSYAEVAQHDRQLREDLVNLGISEFVTVADTPGLLPDEWPGFVRERAKHLRLQVRKDPDYAAELENRIHSLTHSLNTTIYGWTYEWTVLVYGVLTGQKLGIPDALRADAEQLLHGIQQTAVTYDAVNVAIRAFKLTDLAAQSLTDRPDHFRLTVHAKPGEPRPLITQNGPGSRPALIPMHGVALHYPKADEKRVRTIFDLEARVNGYRPVFDPAGRRVLFFEAPSSSRD